MVHVQVTNPICWSWIGKDPVHVPVHVFVCHAHPIHKEMDGEVSLTITVGLFILFLTDTYYLCDPFIFVDQGRDPPSMAKHKRDLIRYCMLYVPARDITLEGGKNTVRDM
jgi:hypothetical protein